MKKYVYIAALLAFIFFDMLLFNFVIMYQFHMSAKENLLVLDASAFVMTIFYVLMICFSIYLAIVKNKFNRKLVVFLTIVIFLIILIEVLEISVVYVNVLKWVLLLLPPKIIFSLSVAFFLFLSLALDDNHFYCIKGDD